MRKTHQYIYNMIINEGYKDNSLTYIFETTEGLRKEYRVVDLFNTIRDIEKTALRILPRNSRILDVGAGAGRISVYLQKEGFDVTALEKSRVICDILKRRGVRKIVNADIFEYSPGERYDVVLFFYAWSILGKTKDSIEKVFVLLNDRLLHKDGLVFFVFKDYFFSGSVFMKRRFIFKGQKSFWFKTYIFDSEKLVSVGQRYGWCVKYYYKDSAKQYYLIMGK